MKPFILPKTAHHANMTDCHLSRIHSRTMLSRMTILPGTQNCISKNWKTRGCAKPRAVCTAFAKIYKPPRQCAEWTRGRAVQLHSRVSSLLVLNREEPPTGRFLWMFVLAFSFAELAACMCQIIAQREGETPTLLPCFWKQTWLCKSRRSKTCRRGKQQQQKISWRDCYWS